MPSTLISEPINRFYYGYLAKTDAAVTIIGASRGAYEPLDLALIECVREAFQAGARWQLRETAKLSPYISRFLEMCVLLGPDAPRDAWLELTDVAPRPDDEEWCANVPF